MKFTKVLTASAFAAAIAATMGISASAATWQEAVQAAKDCGVQSHNVQELSNFLEPNASKFTAAQYDDMIADMKAVSDKYVAPKATELFNKKPGDLTEDEKIQIGKTWSEDDKQAIINDLVALGAKYNVEVTVTKADKAHYNVSAKMKDGSGTQTTTTSAVAGTGAEAAETGAGNAVAFAGVALVLAATGAVIVSRKNRA
ncbi:hypothetical protein SAMN02910447_02126 [Ruminococcus sp. YE71]|uniref:hypothetical protein n=1 Tax=unclassified Ruminococcus TaxID=2608920 RepID=UPI0008821708|nr:MULTISPECIES: hypothetical protein [unclassified Ruminococcus]SDA21940.1 hypothetical protein SAMN02910446_01995 [Ruminococcus sp. YE78]SFW37176.1 hypothetical protein SAMN02910447_02126 [Ruminococcus sp. YE71]